MATNPNRSEIPSRHIGVTRFELARPGTRSSINRAFLVRIHENMPSHATPIYPSSLRQKSRASMRFGFGPGSRRPDAAVLAEIRASPDNEEPGPKTQAATARLLPQAANCDAVIRTIEIGGMTKPQLMEELERRSILMNEYARRLFADSRFVTSTSRSRIQTVEVAVRDLGFGQGAICADICQRAAGLGLEVCPLELGPFMRLQYRDQPEGPRLPVFSERLSADVDVPTGFYLRCLDRTLWLRGYTASQDWLCDPDEHFVFKMSER
jgi:hypothetical protein